MNRVEPSETLRDFKAKDIDGKKVRLSKLKGKKVVLSFFRYAECIFCNLHIRKLQQVLKLIDTNTYYFIAVFQSPDDDIKNYFGDKLPEGIVLADPKRRLYRLYGVEEQNFVKLLLGAVRIDKLIHAFIRGIGIKMGYGSKTLVPADFLIDENGRIEEAYYGKDITDHLDVNKVFRFLNKQKET